MDKIDELKTLILSSKSGKIEEELMFKDITTLKIGGKIRLVFYPKNVENFIFVMRKIEEFAIKWVIIGAGSNVLCSDDDFDGVVISFSKLNVMGYLIGEYLYLYSGFKLNQLYKLFGPYYGFSKLSLIPGTIGGGIVSNAGVFGFNLSEIIEDVLVYNQGDLMWIKNDGTIFGYRDSIFKNSKMVIIQAKIRLSRGNKDYEKWLAIKNNNQKVKGYNAGSTFKNPIGYSAWKLIKDNVQIKRVGSCMISPTHSNFLVNTSNGKSSEMITLINSVKDEVLKKCGILLELEWGLINFD